MKAKKKAPKVVKAWGLFDGDRFFRAYPTRAVARIFGFQGERIARVEIREVGR